MASSAKQKFDAAVNVIQNLPKNGTFQPSHELMLKFYAYYKQATLGPCTQPKPSFWEVVKKAKWDAWNGLGKLPKEEAMVKYVEELKQIIETMPQTQIVGDFIETLGSFYEIVEDKAADSKDSTQDIKNEQETEQIASGTKSEIGNNSSRNIAVKESNGDHIAQSSGLYTTGNSMSDWETVPRPIEVTVKDVRSESSDSGHQESDEFCIENGAATNVTEQLDSTGAFVIKLDTESMTGKLGRTASPKVPNGNQSGDEDSDSDESELFCDTTEPDDQQVPALVSISSASSSTPIKASPKIGNVYRAITTPEEASQWAMSPIKTNGESDTWGSGKTDTRGSAIHRLNNSNHIQSQGNERTIDQIDGDRTENARVNRDNLAAEEGSVGLDAEQFKGVQARGGGETTSAPGGSQDRQSSEGSSGSRRQGSSEQLNPRPSRHQNSAGSGGGNQDGSGREPDNHTSEQIAIALMKLQQDMNSVLTRLQTLETLTIVQRQVREHEEAEAERKQRDQTAWWPFQNLNPSTVVALVAWPFVAQWLIRFLFRRRNRKP